MSLIGCTVEKFGLQIGEEIEVGRNSEGATASWTAAVPCRFRTGLDSRTSGELDRTRNVRKKRENTSGGKSGRGLPQSKKLSRSSPSHASRCPKIHEVN